MMASVQAIDSHTGGEPTRVIFGEHLGLQGTSLLEQGEDFAQRFSDLRTAWVCEPRGSDFLVGALVLPGFRAATGVIFFNNVGVLGMCGHGTIGLARTLLAEGIWSPGKVSLDTPVGVVELEIEESGATTFQNVESYVGAENISVEVDGRRYSGAIAWGGNGFFLCEDHGLNLDLGNLQELMNVTTRLLGQFRKSNPVAGIVIDHIELIGPPHGPADARSFVLCPGQAYDRSPCGTGTSAKIALLAHQGKLSPGQVWRQESITGSVFEGWYHEAGPRIRPCIKGIAHLTARVELLFDPNDPLKHGFTGAER